VKHYTTSRFWRHYDALPDAEQKRADRKFELLKANPYHPSLHFKRVGRYWSARVSDAYRALGLDHPNGIYWFWIGTHDEYDRLIAK
jgi:hypothetical protein